jgi:hypothetical protein
MNTTGIAVTCKALELEIDRLLNPMHFYSHPRDVVADPSLSSVEKRAVLSSWASESCAVNSHPVLRNPPNRSRAIQFDDVMDALRELDSLDDNPPRRSLWKRSWPRASTLHKVERPDVLEPKRLGVRLRPVLSDTAPARGSARPTAEVTESSRP